MRTCKCDICGFSFTEADKSWDSAIDSGQCPECLEPLRKFSVRTKQETLPPLRDFPVRSKQEEPLPTQQPKRQEEGPATPQPYPWGSVLGWVLFAFLLGLTTARPTWKSATSIDRTALGVLVGMVYAVLTAAIVGSWKYFKRNSSPPFGGNTWKRVTVDEAKKHSLYGVGGWLAWFIFSNLFGLLQEVGRINVEASKIGVSLGRFLGLDTPLARFLEVTLAIDALSVTIILWFLFSKHQSFRHVSSYILLGLWPAEALVGLLVTSPDLAYVLAVNFVPYVFYCAAWVPYLQKSKRVRVTFEHCVKVDQDNVSSLRNDVLSDASTTDATAGNTDQRLDDHKPAVTREPVRDQQFEDYSSGTRVQATSSGISNEVSCPRPAANPRSPVSIPAESGQPVSTVLEDRLYEQIAQELEANAVDKGIWTNAYAQAGGDDKQTRVLYIKLRFTRLLAIEGDRKESIRQERK